MILRGNEDRVFGHSPSRRAPSVRSKQPVWTTHKLSGIGVLKRGQYSVDFHSSARQTYNTISGNMPLSKRSKPRLHLALYARPKCPDTLHYALLICPKDSSSHTTKSSSLVITKHHVKNVNVTLSQPWVYETTEVANLSTEPRILTSVIIAKILVHIQRIHQLLHDVLMYQADDPSGKGQGFGCVEWMRLAIQKLKAAGGVTENSLVGRLSRKHRTPTLTGRSRTDAGM